MTPLSDFTITYHLSQDPFLTPGLSKSAPEMVSLFSDETISYFLREPLRIPSLPIHHHFQKAEPSSSYLTAIEGWLHRLRRLLPESFLGMQWGFEPSNALSPALFEEVGPFLMVIRFDLSFRRAFHRLVKRGDNDRTAEYETDRVFFTFDFLPLLPKQREAGCYDVRPLFDTTWVGEKGRGYYLQGIWMDDSLTEFFSRLVHPDLEISFPYYPLRCRFRSLSANTPNLDQGTRSRLVHLLQKILDLPDNVFKEIQITLKNQDRISGADLIQTYRQKLGLDGPFPIPDVKIKSKRLAENGQVEFIVDVAS